MKKTVLLIATLDTKEAEARYLKQRIEQNGVAVLLMDIGILAAPQEPPDIDQETVAARGGMPLETARRTDKFTCTELMGRGGRGMVDALYREGRIQGVVAVGGGQGTQIATTAMRGLPAGVPCLMVSTVANGRHCFGPYVGTRDLTIMHAVCDIQGLNFMTRRLLQNAAGSISGMVLSPEPHIRPHGAPVALSMLGTTTAGALHVKQRLEADGYEVVAFHQNGTGGIAMEDMIRDRLFTGVLDLNLHEIADRQVGGLHAALRPDRLSAAADTGLPQVVAPGSVNYMVQGPPETIPPHLAGRACFYNNPQFTLVRLSREELAAVGQEVARKLNRATGPVRCFIPLRGFSAADREGQPHWDPEGNRAFSDALKSLLSPAIPLVELDAHINDPAFSDAVVEAFIAMMKSRKT